jgi:hypothetical protein
MASWQDRLNRFSGKTRFVVSRIFLHLQGDAIVPLLGTLNRVGLRAIETDGDLENLGEGLVDIANQLLELEIYWQSASNEGDVCWQEAEAGDYVTELFTDSAQRYLSGAELEGSGREGQGGDDDTPLTLPLTQNIVVMLTIAFEGEESALEGNLADISALKQGLKALINLHYQHRLRAIQVHFSPAQLGDELTADQVLANFTELVPL